MNKHQTNILNMSHAVDRALVGIVATNPVPSLVAKHEALKAKIAEIEAHGAVQALPTTGATVDRTRAFAAAIDATLVVAGLVRSYARTQQLGTLEAQVRLTRSTFTFSRLAHRIPLMRQVHAAAQEVLPQLADVGVTAETLASLQAKIDAADAMKSESRTTVVVRRTATKTLHVLVRELMDLLEHHLDPQMNALRESIPEEWETYRGARNVINHTGTPAKAEPEIQVSTASVAPAEKLAA